MADLGHCQIIDIKTFIQMKKSILIATAVFPPEPVVSASLMMDLALELSKDFDVTVLCPKPSRPMGFDQPKIKYPKSIKVITIKDSYTCPQSSLIGRLRESISYGNIVADYIDKNFKSINIIYNAVWPLYGKNIVAKSAIKHGIKYVTSVQDIYPESILSKLPRWKLCKWIINSLFGRVDRYTEMNASAIHTISEGMAEYLSQSRKINREKYHVIRNWQNDTDFISYRSDNPIRVHRNDPFTFMYMGNVGPLAGLENVIDAFLLSKIEGRLVIAGSGSAKSELITRVKMNPKIEFWDVPRGQVPAIQDKADVMVLCIKKGFAKTSIPSKLPAYMFSTKPILCAVDEDSDTAKCIKDADGGWVVEAENTNALAIEMIKCVHTSDEELVKKGQNNFKYAIDNFSREKGVKKLADIFIKLIK